MAAAMEVDPAILVHSFQYGLDQYVLPYEYDPFMLAMGMGYIGFRDMALVMLARMVVMAAFLGCVAVPFWMMVSARASKMMSRQLTFSFIKHGNAYPGSSSVPHVRLKSAAICWMIWGKVIASNT